MQISTRFTVALHIFACVEAFSGKYKVTSDFLAASINTNPVIVRKILGQLSRSGLISVARGTGGIELVRPPEEITFYDVYRAVESVEHNTLYPRAAGSKTSCHSAGDGKQNARIHRRRSPGRNPSLRPWRMIRNHAASVPTAAFMFLPDKIRPRAFFRLSSFDSCGVTRFQGL